MSKIGKQKIKISNKLKVNIDNNYLTIKGPNGKLSINFPNSINITIDDLILTVSPKIITKKIKPLWGLMRSLVNNMVTGVTDGFVKKLEIHGVGYKASINDNLLLMSLGYSHNIIYPLPLGISITCIKNIIKVSGCDKHLVGQVCADIRNLRKPEPYKGKGIRYQNEIIIKKEGKKK
jgi:large subunit ribosomal protein L6